MAANENFRLSHIRLPDLPISGITKMGQLFIYLRELVAAIIRRDVEIKNKINQLHIEYTETEPSAAPDDPEPVFRIYKESGNYYLYVYINSVWKRTTLV